MGRPWKRTAILNRIALLQNCDLTNVRTLRQLHKEWISDKGPQDVRIATLIRA